MKQFNNLLELLSVNKKLQFCIFLLTLSFLSVFAMLCYGSVYFGHDIGFHLRRFESLITALHDGTFPIYIDYAAENGYGYLSNTFYPDIILLPFALVAMITNVSFAFMLLIFSTTMSCGIFMYLTVNKIYKNSFTASVSAILYTFSYYRLLDVYYRATIGEVISFSLLPIVFLGLYYIIEGDYRKWYIITIGFTLMIFNHLLSSLFLFIVVIIFCLAYYKKLWKEPKRLKYLLLAGIVTLGITLFFFFPLLEQITSNSFYYQTQKWIIPANAKIKILTILSSVSFANPFLISDPFPPKIGFLLTIGILLRLFIKQRNPLLKFADVGMYIGLYCLFLSSSLFPWELFPFNKLDFIQFAWRLFEFSVYFFSIAAAYYITILLKSRKRMLISFAALLVITCFVITTDSKNYKEFFKKELNSTNKNRRNKKLVYSNFASLPVLNLDTGYLGWGLEYLPSRVPGEKFMQNRGDSIKYLNKDTETTNLEKKRGITTLDVQLSQADSLELPLIYYKGYAAYLNDNPIAITQSRHGLIQLAIDQPGKVKVYYAGTSIQRISLYISLISLILFCIYIYLQKRKRQPKLN